MMSFFAPVFFQLFLTALATQWPAVDLSAEDALPNIELSLAPPLHVWPQVAAALGDLEESRERMENANMDKLQHEFNEAMVDARHQIGNMIGRMMHIFDDRKLVSALFARHSPKSTMFRQLPQEALGSSALSVEVNVLPASPPEPGLRANIDDMEHQRSDEEKNMFQSKAFSELHALKRFILSELEVQMQAHVNALIGAMKNKPTESTPSFLHEQTKQLPAQSNIRVVPADEEYPSVVSMVQEMETRRDITENLERKHILEKELDFAMVCNTAAEEGLRAAVSRVLGQYSSMATSR